MVETSSTDTLGRLIDNDLAQRLVRDTPIVYGVWLDGQGWLSNEQGRVFATSQPEVAQTARLLWGKDAQVHAFDSSLKDLERIFLVHRVELKRRSRLKRLLEWLKSLWRI